jgi:peptidoglycan biosynthesis protein MviN/MurJ (putative lipid II flippase)
MTAARPEARGRRSLAGNAAITSASQAATMITGGLLAVLVAAMIGSTAETDGFFAAYGVYAMIVSFAQSARTTIVARLLESETRFGAFDAYLGAGVLIFGVVVLAFGPLGGLVTSALTGDLPDAAGDTARQALLVLVAAVACQLFAALGAAMLGALEEYVAAGVSFVAGSLLSVVAFVVLEPSLGIDALAVALLIGSVLSALVIAVALVRQGWRPAPAALVPGGASVRGARILVLSSVSFLLAQLGFVVTLAFAARLGVGTVTVFSYAYMAMGLVQAVFASSVPMVMAAPLAKTWDRRPESLVPHTEAIFRTGAMLLVPVVAAAWLIGDEVGELVLASFTAAQVDKVIELFLVLVPTVLIGLASAVPYAAVVAIGRYAAIAIATVGVVAVQVAIAAVAAGAESVNLLAAAVPISAVASMLTTWAIVDRRYPARTLPPLLRATVVLALAGAVTFGAAGLLAQAAGGALADAVAFVLGLAGFAALIWLVLPAQRDLASRLLSALPQRQAPAGMQR